MQQISLEQYELLNPSVPVVVDGRTLVFNTPNRNALWRVQTLATKEPDTIAWLNGFLADEILFDIGANVGMYTVYAAAMRAARVMAFEPESQNYALLNRNIYSNQLGEKVRAFPLAISDTTALDALYLSRFSAGESCHNFGAAIDFGGRAFTPGFAQGCVSLSLDDLVEKHGLAEPDHIKVDVDGLEHKVIAGARRLLEKRRVKSVLVEINTNLPEHRDIITRMASCGYGLSAVQVDTALRNDGPFKGVGNHIFVRL